MITWWTASEVPNPVTITVVEDVDGYTVSDDGYASPPEVARDVVDAEAMAVLRMNWYTLQGFAVAPWTVPGV